MDNLSTFITEYLKICESIKKLDNKTINTYRIAYYNFIHSCYHKMILLIKPPAQKIFRGICSKHDLQIPELLEADVDIRYIQKMLGHSSIKTTELYTNVSIAKQNSILVTKHPRNSMKIDFSL